MLGLAWLSTQTQLSSFLGFPSPGSTGTCHHMLKDSKGFDCHGVGHTGSQRPSYLEDRELFHYNSSLRSDRAFKCPFVLRLKLVDIQKGSTIT